jgi:thioredoxin 1
MLKVIEIETEEMFYDIVLRMNKDTLVVVDFYADWCGPCKRISPVYQKLSEIYKGVCFLKVNVDRLDGLVHQYGIKAMPTFLCFKNCKKMGEVVGVDMLKLEKLIKESI